MTARMYAERKNWPLEKVLVDLTFSRIYAADRDGCGRKEGIDREEDHLHWRLGRDPMAEASSSR